MNLKTLTKGSINVKWAQKTQQRDTKDSINSTKDSPNGHKRLNKGTQKTQKGRILQKEISVHQK